MSENICTISPTIQGNFLEATVLGERIVVKTAEEFVARFKATQAPMVPSKEVFDALRVCAEKLRQHLPQCGKQDMNNRDRDLVEWLEKDVAHFLTLTHQSQPVSGVPSDFEAGWNAAYRNMDESGPTLEQAKKEHLLTRGYREQSEGENGIDFMVLPGIITAYYPFDAIMRANGVTSNDEKTAVAQMAVHAISKHLTATPPPSNSESAVKILEALRKQISGGSWDSNVIQGEISKALAALSSAEVKP